MNQERNSLEADIIRAIMFAPGRFRSVRGTLAPAYFLDPLHRRIMGAIHKADDAGIEINVLNVATAGELKGDDAAQLLSLGEMSGHLPLLARRLAEHVVGERLMLLRSKIEPGMDVFELLRELREADGDCWELIQRNARKDKLQLLIEYTESLHRAARGENQRYATGFPSLDRLLDGGLEPGGLTLIGGTPGSGKTSFMLNIALHLAKNGTKSAIIEAEMTANEILQRSNGIYSAANIREIRRGKRFEDLSQGFISNMYDLPIDFRFPIRRNVETLANEIRDLAGDGYRVIFCDYLQPFADKSGSAKDEHVAIKRVSETLRALALEYEVNLCVGSSLNRSESGIDEGKLSLHSLYGSSSLGHDASVVLLLAGKQNDHAELMLPLRTVTLTVAKARNDARGDLAIEFRLDSQMMREMEVLRKPPAIRSREDRGEEDESTF